MSTEILVRTASALDVPALAGVAAQTFPLACPPDATPEDVAAFIAEHLSADHFAGYVVEPRRDVLVAEVDGVLVGYAMTVAGEPGDPDVARAVQARPTLELSKLYVLPGHHGAGVSARLVAAVVDRARDRRALSVWLGVNQENVRAQRFYTKSRFVRVGVKTFLVGDQVHDDFVMERPLA